MLLRRTKGSLIDGQPIVELPAREVRHARLKFPPAERANYDQLQQRSMAELKVSTPSFRYWEPHGSCHATISAKP